LTKYRWASNVILGVLGAIILSPLVNAIEWAADAGYRAVAGSGPKAHPFVTVLNTTARAPEILAVGLLAVVVAPLLEEVIFRGVLQRWLSAREWGAPCALGTAVVIAAATGYDRHPLAPVCFVLLLAAAYPALRRMLKRSGMDPEVTGAVYGTAVLFAASHSNVWPTPVPLFALGLCLGYLAERTQSLVGPMSLHALFNATSCLALFYILRAGVDPETGTATTRAERVPSAAAMVSSVPGASCPRRTVARARPAPSAGEETQELTEPTSFPDAVTRLPGGTGATPSTRNAASARLTCP
jgi:membrane protease YdiL (CAAX protease family)